jgi:DNA-binding CsgD family transcriptional regulator
MSDPTLNGTFVTICDWRGQIVWQSARQRDLVVGDFAWENLAPASLEQAKLAFARSVSLRETMTLEWVDVNERRSRVWLWPLEHPDWAVCLLAVTIPRELARLTEREREILGLLALGRSTREIAQHLDVSTSTVHTHLRRARRRLSLSNVESLTGFAARFCHPTAAPTALGPAALPDASFG